MTQDPIIGIDLGTTNSAVAVVVDGTPQLLSVTPNESLLPSYVGLDATGSLLVGRAARNQYALYPERTIRSIKRQMGQEVTLPLGDREYTPPEISAMLLRRLKQAAELQLGCEVTRAVITVPAFFSDAQRTATREAGKLAGLTVERIINEPTAAALCYTSLEDSHDRTFLIYDLGGGTFDVSIVRVRGDITEVLSSHGDTALGGDDFDAALQAHITEEFNAKHNTSLADDVRANARLTRAAEEAKIQLSTEPYVQITEEHLVTKDGAGLHLDMELERGQYEALILPLLEKTKRSIQEALSEAEILARDLDEVILVGGSTRTPLVSELLHDLLGLMPRCDVDPEKAVALGAALQAARIAGDDRANILVDVSPYSFGTSYFGELGGLPSPHCYKAIIKRNTPIPTRQTEVFYTMVDGQREIEVHVFQGEEKDARDNHRIGLFTIEGLDRKAEAGSAIVFVLKLDLDGILHVEVTEKRTGLNKGITIEDAFRKMSDEELATSRSHIASLMDDLLPALAEELEGIQVSRTALPGASPETTSTPDATAGSTLKAPADLPEAQRALWVKGVSLLDKATLMLPGLESLDREEVEELVDALRATLEEGALDKADEQINELADVLFYLE